MRSNKIKLKNVLIKGFFIFFTIFFLTLKIKLFFLVRKIYAQEISFIKYQNNPLNIDIPEPYLEILQVNILYFKNHFKGIFSLYNKNTNQNELYYYESENGINWLPKRKIETNTINSFSPRIFVKDNNNFILYFTSFIDNVYRIHQINCDNNLICHPPSKIVLSPENEFETNGVFSGFRYLVDNKNYLFYGSWNNGFHINLAISNDGENWERCPNNPILNNYDAPFIWEKNNNQRYIFYHVYDSSGIKYGKINKINNCDIQIEEISYLLTKEFNYDNKHLIFPSIIELNNNIYLFYSGKGNYGWSLNLATQLPIEISPTPNYPLLLLPGLFASWNKKAILYNQSVGIYDWELLPFIKEYDGIIGTLKNLGYQENKDFFIFPYDWRQSLNQSSEDLKNFIQKKIPQEKKVNLIGHSLGGMVARIFAQKNKDKVNKIITVGSPHQGAVQVYKPLSAGEIDQQNDFLWLAQKVILVLNKTKIESDRETVRKKFPVAFDLFPTFNFLKKKNGEEIPINTLSIKNNLLNQYNQTFQEIFPIFVSFYGLKSNTPLGYIIDTPTPLNKLLGNYQDGQPIDIFYDQGDNTVLKLSANQDTDSKELPFDHGEIITEKTAIKQILKEINIEVDNHKIIAGKKTIISPSLIFFIKSPAKISLQLPDQSIINEYEGIIFLNNPSYGDYQLQIQGISKGKYTLIAGQINTNDELWEFKEGEIINEPPEFQIENYSFTFNQHKLNYIFPKPTLTPTPIIQIITSLTPIPTLTINQKITPSTTINSSSNLSNNTSQLSLNPQELSSKINKRIPQILGESTSKKLNNNKLKENKKEIKNKNIFGANNYLFFNKIIIFISLFFFIIFLCKFKKIYIKKIKNNLNNLLNHFFKNN